MKFIISVLLLVTTHQAICQKRGYSQIISFGLDYRIYPIDIENVPRGPLPPDKGLPYDNKRFWQPISLQGHLGLMSKKNWLYSFSFYGRYNLLHRLEGMNFTYPYTYPKNMREKKNFKFDTFFDVEKKLPPKENKERYFLISAGIGLTNINSKFNITLTDTIETGPLQSQLYEGTFLHFTPRVSIGYQYEKIKASIDTYFIEDPNRSNLTSLWFGGTISYELLLKKKKSN